MTHKFNNLIDLVKIVSEMERDLGLSDISNSERKVLLAISDLENREGVAKTKAILSHELTVGISRPSVFRALAKFLMLIILVKVNLLIFLVPQKEKDFRVL